MIREIWDYPYTSALLALLFVAGLVHDYRRRVWRRAADALQCPERYQMPGMHPAAVPPFRCQMFENHRGPHIVHLGDGGSIVWVIRKGTAVRVRDLERLIAANHPQ